MSEYDPYDDAEFFGDDEDCRCEQCEGFPPFEIPKTIDQAKAEYIAKPDPVRDEAEKNIKDAYSLISVLSQMDTEPYGEIPAKGERICDAVEETLKTLEQLNELPSDKLSELIALYESELNSRGERLDDAEHMAVYGETRHQYLARQRRGQTKPLGDVQPIAYPSPQAAIGHAVLDSVQILDSQPIEVQAVVQQLLTPPPLKWPEPGDNIEFGDEEAENAELDRTEGPATIIEFPTKHDQPPPVSNDEDAVWPQVVDEVWDLELDVPGLVIDAMIEDMNERAEVGFKRYGTHLQPFNGRDALRDAYSESLDQIVYLKQAWVEEDHESLLSELDEMYVNAVEAAARLRHLIILRDGLK
jgi:hypothetical protein